MRIKENKDAQITFRLGQETKDKIERICDKREIPVSQYVLAAVKKQLREEEDI